MKKIKYTGKVWHLYKPVKETSLYGQIVNDPANANVSIIKPMILLFLYIYIYPNFICQEIVNKLYHLHKRNPHVSEYLIIEFCIHVTGFQHFKLGNVHNLNDTSAKTIVKSLEEPESVNASQPLKVCGMFCLLIIQRLHIY